MGSSKQTGVNLHEPAQKVKDELSPFFGLKNILSASLVWFGKLKLDDQKQAIAEAQGIAEYEFDIYNAQKKLDNVEKFILDLERAELQGAPHPSAEYLKQNFYEIVNKPPDQSPATADGFRNIISIIRQYFPDGNVDIEMLSAEDRALVDELIKDLGPKKPKKKPKSKAE